MSTMAKNQISTNTARHRWLAFHGLHLRNLFVWTIYYVAQSKRSLLPSQGKTLNHSKLFHSKKIILDAYFLVILILLAPYSVILSASCRCVEYTTYNLDCRGFLVLIVVYPRVQDG